jgi:hypothetical protein
MTCANIKGRHDVEYGAALRLYSESRFVLYLSVIFIKTAHPIFSDFEVPLYYA